MFKLEYQEIKPPLPYYICMHTVGPYYTAVEYLAMRAKHRQAQDWLKANCIDTEYYHTGGDSSMVHSFFFKNKEDALLFKLALA